MIDRYHRVGLRRNPFAAPGPTGISGDAFVSRGLPTPPPPGRRTLVQVIGDEGAGKTTHIHQWRRLRPGPYHYIPRQPYRSRWADGPVGPIVYGDEINRMPVPVRRRWFKGLAAIDATLVIATHSDLSSVGRRFGFATVTHRLPPLDLDTFTRIVEHRLAAEAIDPTGGGRFRFDQGEVELIFHRSSGQLRDAEDLCHMLLAERIQSV